MNKRIERKPLLVVGTGLVVVVLVFAAGWMFGRGPGDGSGKARPAEVAAAAQPDAGPVGQQIDVLRRGVPIDQEATPPPMARVENADIKRVRDYPMQPPTIPHSIDNYEVSKNTNRCMLCHSRANAGKFQATPVSVTHYMDRDAQFLATVSPRRYFCNQCHVVQTDARPLVANTFEDIDAVMAAAEAGTGVAK